MSVDDRRGGTIAIRRNVECRGSTTNPWLRRNGAMRSTRFPSICAVSGQPDQNNKYPVGRTVLAPSFGQGAHIPGSCIWITRSARRMAQQLAREGFEVGRLHVATRMRRIGIEALYRKPHTSIPARQAAIHPYLLSGLKIERPSHVRAKRPVTHT
jgi:hypothetical protein